MSTAIKTDKGAVKITSFSNTAFDKDEGRNLTKLEGTVNFLLHDSDEIAGNKIVVEITEGDNNQPELNANIFSGLPWEQEKSEISTANLKRFASGQVIVSPIKSLAGSMDGGFAQEAAAIEETQKFFQRALEIRENRNS
jgi:hypothetical protein